MSKRRWPYFLVRHQVRASAWGEALATCRRVKGWSRWMLIFFSLCLGIADGIDRVSAESGADGGRELVATNSAVQNILVLGDSLSAGYGVAPQESWPSLLQKKISDAQLPFRVINAGVSGDTAAGGLRRLRWQLRQPVEILLLELGGNDGLRGSPIESTRTNLQSIIEVARAKNPDIDVVIAGMEMPKNLGDAYADEFKAMYPRLAKSHQALLIPSLLAGVGGKPELNQPDQIHPTAAGHAIIAENVWNVMAELLKQKANSKNRGASTSEPRGRNSTTN